MYSFPYFCFRIINKTVSRENKRANTQLYSLSHILSLQWWRSACRILYLSSVLCFIPDIRMTNAWPCGGDNLTIFSGRERDQKKIWIKIYTIQLTIWLLLQRLAPLKRALSSGKCEKLFWVLSNFFDEIKVTNVIPSIDFSQIEIMCRRGVRPQEDQLSPDTKQTMHNTLN